MRQTVDATLWCSCPRCYGVRFLTFSEWFDAHRGLDTLLSNEVRIELVEPPEDPQESMRFIGTLDEDGRDLSVLVTVYPLDGMAELCFRRHRWETWDAPTRLVEVE